MSNKVVTTMRKKFLASHNALSAIIYDGKQIYKSKRYDFTVEDRVGGGDANLVMVDEVMDIVSGNASGSVKR